MCSPNALYVAAAKSQLVCLDAPPLTDPPEWPHISVVVCTRDRPLALRSCLESLQVLDYPQSRYEVIVVDNASRETSTRELAFQAGFRCVREEKPGLDNARNCGAARRNPPRSLPTPMMTCVSIPGG